MLNVLSEQQALFWLVIPGTIAWVYVIVDVVRRPGLRRSSRLLWLAAVTVWLPFATLWLLARPVGDPAAASAKRRDPDDPRVQLVDVVRAHDSGALDSATFERERDRLLG